MTTPIIIEDYDPDWPRNRLQHLALYHFADEFEQYPRVTLVIFPRMIKRLAE